MRAYTGGLAEREIFGEIKKGDQALEFYSSYGNSIEFVKKSQPYEDPSEPDKRFPNDLQATIAYSLNLDDYSKLRFYTAVGSHLDKYHGIDAFFELELKGGRIVRATLDVTLDPVKESGGWKADVVFLWPSDGLDPLLPEDKEKYKDKLKEVSERVKECLNKKINK